MPTCFVVMGYGLKADPVTQSLFDLDKSYRNIIKPAAEAAGFSVVRSDEVRTPGHISRQMYKALFDSDLVICDLTTLNPNALFELGVRMAFRPRSTIVIAGQGTSIPFNLNQERFFIYRHDGQVLDHDEVVRFTEVLSDVCRRVATSQEPDSLIYSLFEGELRPPEWIDSGSADLLGNEESVRQFMDRIHALKAQGDWSEVVRLLGDSSGSGSADFETWKSQQLALATYKRRESPAAAAPSEDLLAARALLEERLVPHQTTDPETLGLWGAIHKRLAEAPDRSPAQRHSDLTEAIAAYHKGFVLRDDHYNGVNYAFLMFKRSVEFAEDGERAVADRVRAREAWQRVVGLTADTLELAASPVQAPDALRDGFWRTASLAESLVGLGDPRRGEALERLRTLATEVGESWMLKTALTQIGRLEELQRRGRGLV